MAEQHSHEHTHDHTHDGKKKAAAGKGEIENKLEAFITGAFDFCNLKEGESMSRDNAKLFFENLMKKH